MRNVKLRKMAALVKNPFILTPFVPEEYFCDREKETALLCKHILNGRNVALFADRRLGKTGLIRHCFGQKEIKDNFNTFLVDIYSALGQQLGPDRKDPERILDDPSFIRPCYPAWL